MAALLVPLSMLALVGWLTWLSVWQDAESQMLRAAQSAAEYGKRTLESYASEASRVNERLRGLSDDDIRADEAALHADLKRFNAELSQSELSYVIDRNGFALVSSDLYPVPDDVTLADRDYFQALRAPDAPQGYVSRTFLGRFDGKLLFSVARRRSGTGNPPAPDGFDGVVLVSISPVVLAAGLGRLLQSPGDRMALMRADGYGVSTTSGALDPQQVLPRVDPASPYYEFADRNVESAVYLSTTAMPGSRSLLAMQRIEGYPVYAVSVRPRSDIVATWWRGMAAQLGFGIPATLGLLALSLRVWRDQRLLAARNATLQQANDLSTNRLDRAKRFGLVGTFEFDLCTGVSRRSPEYMSVHGLPPVPTVESHDDWARRVHPDDRERAEAEVFRALSDESAATEYAQTYRIVTASGEVRWIAARGEITRDAAGRSVMLLGAHVDVTPLRTTELALAESDARLRLAQEAVGIGAWEWQRATRRLTCSRKLLELWGMDPTDRAPELDTMLARVHPGDRRRLRNAMALIRRSGGFSGDVRVLRPRPDGEPDTLWIAVRAKLVSTAQTASPRLMGIAFDITERKRAEELTTLMAHEVEHRAKNALAVVSSLLRMTRADTAEEVVRVMDGRVRALGQTMALLGKGRWQGADLREIVKNELRPFETADDGNGLRMHVEGPPVNIGVDAAQPLAMALHELATNAAKYGALSVPGGSVAVTWQLAGDRVHLRWQERGGPPLDRGTPTAGFGSRLITMLFEGQIRGEIVRLWEPEGLVCQMSFSITPRPATTP